MKNVACYWLVFASLMFNDLSVEGGNASHLGGHPASNYVLTSQLNSKTAFRGCRIYNNLGGSVSIPVGSNTKYAFNSSIFDTDNFYNSVTDRIIIPQGVNYVDITSVVCWNSSVTTANSRRLSSLYKNGALILNCSGVGDNSSTYVNMKTGVIPVSEGDYFELYVVNNDTVAKNVLQSNITFMSLEVKG